MRKLDLYFTPEYGRLYETIENAELRAFSYNDQNGEVYYQYLKRPVPFLIDGVQYYDAMTPYGYGGPIVLQCKRDKEAELVKGFKDALDRHLKEEQIICEFVRFHPMEKNAEFFQSIYTLWNRRTAVYTDLSAEDPVVAEFDKHTVQLYRKALRKGVTTVIKQNPDSKTLQMFQDCYFENMKIIGASEYYYFSDSYFDQMRKKMGERLIIVLVYYKGELIGADLGFDDNDVYTCHLIGVTEQGRSMNAARVIVAEQVRWAKDHGFKYLFHGCGKTSDENDGLLKFKKFFTKECFYDCWQGSRMNNIKVYKRLCDMTGNSDDGTYFPAYRKTSD